MLNSSEGLDILNRAPVLNAPENVVLEPCQPHFCYNLSGVFGTLIHTLVTHHTSSTRQSPEILANCNFCNAVAVASSFHHRIACPTSSGSTTLRHSCFATSAYMRPRELGSAGAQDANSSVLGMKPYIKIGEINDPTTLPRTTSITAAVSSPPAERVMTTLEAMVVGRHAVASMPTMMGIDGVPLWRAPAARDIWMMAFC